MDGFTPQTIIDQPIPLLAGGFSNSIGSTSNPVANSDAEAPITQVDQKFPVAIVAIDTISTSLNTETKRILGQYTFEQLGAIQIGTYLNGVSGQISISPDGIVAKDMNGNTTFSLDGTTGDGTFLGTLQAGTLIGGDSTVIISNGSAGGRIVLYNSGVPAILIGDST